ncbi:MAG TPA: class I SAM-dependent methyltransferase [Ignavibacteria bacterium]|nr:class I SAM-dependent methyltransferase [Ignavibacteria bacterium]
MENFDQSKIIYFPFKPEIETYAIPSENEKYDLDEYGLPVPPEEYWYGYGKDAEEHLSDARYDFDIMMNILKKENFNFKPGFKILDLGCAGGRLIRFLKPYADICEIWGTDINAEIIQWDKKYLRPPFNFAVTTTIPHLPFKDGYFNFIYCGSIFTHIDDLADAWLLELRRVLSKDGLLYITLHDYNTINELKENSIYKNLWLKKEMEQDQVYINYKGKFSMLVKGRGPASQVFYDMDYFCNSVSTFFETVSVNLIAYGHQSGVLLRCK